MPPRDQAAIAAKRKAAAERQARRRERQKAQRDPEAFAAEQAAKAAAEQEAVAKAAAADEQKRAAEQQKAEEIAALVEPLHQALTVIAEAAAGIVRRTSMPKEAPPLGRERADAIASAWAPVLAPYLREHLKTNPAILAAALVTAGVCAEWATDIDKAVKAAHPKPPAHPALADIPLPKRQEPAA